MLDTLLEIAKILAMLKNIDLEDKDAFYYVLNRCSLLADIRDRDLAVECEVSLPTVTRWKNGLGAPHPSLRKYVYRYLRRRLLEHTAVEAGLAEVKGAVISSYTASLVNKAIDEVLVQPPAIRDQVRLEALTILLHDYETEMGIVWN